MYFLCKHQDWPPVWSPGGPVPEEVVDPRFRLQLKSSVVLCVHPQKPLVNWQLKGPLLGATVVVIGVVPVTAGGAAETGCTVMLENSL